MSSPKFVTLHDAELAFLAGRIATLREVLTQMKAAAVPVLADIAVLQRRHDDALERAKARTLTLVRAGGHELGDGVTANLRIQLFGSGSFLLMAEIA